MEIALGDYFIILSGDDYFIDFKRVSHDVEFLRKRNNVSAIGGGGIAKYILMGLRKYIKIELQCHGFGEESIFIYHALLLKEKCRKMYWNGYVMIQA